MTYPFAYEVVIYIDDDDYIIECGLGLATGFADAARIIEQRYDPDLVCIKSLELLESDTTIIVSKEVKDKIVKEEYINETIHCDAHGDVIDPVEKFIDDFIEDSKVFKSNTPAKNSCEDWDTIDAAAEDDLKSKRKVDSL